MDRSQFTDISSFTLQGRLLRRYGKQPQKPKALQIETSKGKYRVEIPVRLRKQGCQNLVLGDWVWVTGTLQPKSKCCRLEAVEIRVILPEVSPSVLYPTEQTYPAVVLPHKILICQESDCMKRGAKAVEKVLETVLCDRNLTGTIKIKKTGCMGGCKKGPNIVVMPGKHRYQNVKPSDIPRLLSLT
ncbi:MAG: (2Fe-2S) ferredoxin domain-containing protein [Thermosynechococcaceae cyanobacterium]